MRALCNFTCVSYLHAQTQCDSRGRSGIIAANGSASAVVYLQADVALEVVSTKPGNEALSVVYISRDQRQSEVECY